jgi:hypothetical protein
MRVKIGDAARVEEHKYGASLFATGTEIFMGIRNFWLIKCQRCKEENLSQRII